MNNDSRLIRAGLDALDLMGKDVAVHSSLRSFGHVEGGAETVVRALLETCGTVLMPSFCSIGRTTAPPGDQPVQNAWDYSLRKPQSNPERAFDPSDFGPASDMDTPDMGQIALALLRRQGTMRSQHPSVSWAANGPSAAQYMADHVPNDPNRPLKWLSERGGHILLLGVGLKVCTAVHLAEEMAGRRPFIRWVRYSDGQVRRVREYGCSDGFDKLAKHVEPAATRTTIGQCVAVTYPMQWFVETIAKTISATQEITLCGREECRCVASALGGPIE